MTEVFSKRNSRNAAEADDKFYQVHEATRNAQTVSIRKRHLPVFQLFVDVVMALFATTICSTAVIAQVAAFVKPNADGTDTSVFAYSWTSAVLLGTILIWFSKFFFGVGIYRFKLHTNESKHTNNLFFMRLIFDLICLLALPITLMVVSVSQTNEASDEDFNFMTLLYCFIALQTLSVVIVEGCVYYFCVSRALMILAGVETESGKPITKEKA